MRMPLPPPPADALTITGRPIWRATASASAASPTMPSEPGVPVTPGSEGIVGDAAEAEAVARQIGLPVMVKASAGGGGKGIRIVKDASELAAAVRQAQGEAEAAFGNGAVYVEKYIGSPRHIEIC